MRLRFTTHPLNCCWGYGALFHGSVESSTSLRLQHDAIQFSPVVLKRLLSARFHVFLSFVVLIDQNLCEVIVIWFFHFWSWSFDLCLVLGSCLIPLLELHRRRIRWIYVWFLCWSCIGGKFGEFWAVWAIWAVWAAWLHPLNSCNGTGLTWHFFFFWIVLKRPHCSCSLQVVHWICTYLELNGPVGNTALFWLAFESLKLSKPYLRLLWLDLANLGS